MQPRDEQSAPVATAPYSPDALRLLYAIERYTVSPGTAEGRRWLKQDSLYVIALLGVSAGAFKAYDVAPALFEFRGVKMFAMLSQEAVEDINLFFHEGLIQKILLNTWYYATLTAVRITDKGSEVLRRHLRDEDRVAIDRLICCAHCDGRTVPNAGCRGLVDFAVSIEEASGVRLVMNRVCSCRCGALHTKDDAWTKKCKGGVTRIDEFFGIGEVEYRARPFFIGVPDAE